MKQDTQCIEEDTSYIAYVDTEYRMHDKEF